jgi:two-component system sensor histidine kinase KdpD
MLQAAQRERLAGRDVVLACVQDPRLAAKSPVVKELSKLSTTEPGKVPSAVDLEAVLARRPDIVVVDELAFSNSSHGRHPKRYQDVVELVEAGIDVFTTLNVGQVASRADAFRQLTGVGWAEQVPDSVLDFAELELVDLAARDLLRRISLGETRLAPTEAAKAGLLEESTLLGLRELTARLFTERVGRDVSRHLAEARISGPAVSGQRLLAVVRPDEDSEPVVRWTRRLAENFRCDWVVLYVETAKALRGEQQERVTKTLAFARELGADVVTTADQDEAGAVLRVAAQRNVTQVVAGRAGKENGRWWLKRDEFVRRLLRESRDVAVQLVPTDSRTDSGRGGARHRKRSATAQYARALGVVAVVTLAAFSFTPVVGAHATALIFLLMVVLLALFVERGPALAAAAVSAVVWDYFFLPPVFAFRISHFEDAMFLAMYFVVALVLGHLTTRIRAQEEAEREREARATALYLLTRDLNESVGLDQMVQRIVQQVESSFNGQVAVLTPNRENTLMPHAGSTLQVPESEQEVAQWALMHRQRAGRFTSNLPSATGLYIPLVTTSGPVGVLALNLKQKFGTTVHQDNLLDAFSQQIAMALDRHRLNGISEKANLLAESERLSKTLLDSVSHEIRTPIAAIKSATGNLVEMRDEDSQMRQEMVEEIQEATERLNRVVGNVLEASRLESGSIKPRLNECDVSELVHVALAETEKELSAHKVTVSIESGLPVVPMDFVLMQQALTNLLSNAAFHTPPGTAVQVGARLEGDQLVLSVADRGPGIPSESLPRLFDKFYRVPQSRTGGTGLGLSLVKGFVEAQGGRVAAQNRTGGGTIFTIRLPRGNPASVPVESEI